MPTPTYTPLATKTLTAAATSVTFSSISQAYRDLVLVFEVSSSSDQTGRLRFNADAGANYNNVVAEANGSTALSAAWNSSVISWTNTYSNISTTKSIVTVNIFDYSVTDKHKSLLIRSGLPTMSVSMAANRWANTAAINSIEVSGATFAIGSVFTLYGIAS